MIKWERTYHEVTHPNNGPARYSYYPAGNLIGSIGKYEVVNIQHYDTNYRAVGLLIQSELFSTLEEAVEYSEKETITYIKYLYKEINK